MLQAAKYKKLKITALVVCLLCVLSLGVAVAAAFLNTNRDTRPAPEKVESGLEKTNAYELLCEKGDYRYYFRDDRDIILIENKNTGYIWKTGVDIALPSEIEEAFDVVNSVLALKAADCSIAMASGSDAAKSASHIVLLKNNFNAMPHIVNEGRRVINNITASASMYLIKTIFSVVLSIGMILFGHGYPFKPIQLTVISACCVGIPTFFLTYEPNFKRVSGDFLKTVFKNAFPFAFMIAICSTIIVNGGRVLGLEKEMLSTICVLLTSWCYYNGLRHIYSPLSHYRIFVIYIMQIVLYISLIVGHQFLGLGNIDYIGAITLMFLVTFSKIIYLLNFELFDYTYLFLQRKRNKHK